MLKKLVLGGLGVAVLGACFWSGKTLLDQDAALIDSLCNKNKTEVYRPKNVSTHQVSYQKKKSNSKKSHGYKVAKNKKSSKKVLSKKRKANKKYKTTENTMLIENNYTVDDIQQKRWLTQEDQGTSFVASNKYENAAIEKTDFSNDQSVNLVGVVVHTTAGSPEHLKGDVNLGSGSSEKPLVYVD